MCCGPRAMPASTCTWTCSSLIKRNSSSERLWCVLIDILWLFLSFILACLMRECAAFNKKKSYFTCWQIAPVIVTGKSLTTPLPRFSLFLCWLNKRNSFFSSSSRELQYWGCKKHKDILIGMCLKIRFLTLSNLLGSVRLSKSVYCGDCL